MTNDQSPPELPDCYERIMLLLIECSGQHLSNSKNCEGVYSKWSKERYEVTERLRSELLGEMVLVMERHAEIERGAVWKTFNKPVTLYGHD